MANLIGQHLGQYEITAILGEGGMATVYRARQQSMKRDVAIKVIESKLARNPDFVKRFQREAETVASLSHIHILRVFDYGDQDDLVYLVMELLTGGSLADLLDRGPLPPEMASRMLDQIASALDYAHRRGIIHRDLKPQNVLLDDAGDIRLTDFGIAKLLGETTVLTQSGVAMGTPAYMAPEQWQGNTLDARADIYSLGIMLFEMLTGQVPFRADTPASMMHAHIYEPPLPVRSFRADLPSGVDAVIQKALAKDPAQRFSSAGELASAFKLALAGQTPVVVFAPPLKVGPVTMVEAPFPRQTPGALSAPIPVPTKRRRVPRILGITGVVVVILLIGGLAFLLGKNNQSAVTPTALSVVVQPTSLVAAVTSTAVPGPTDTSDLTLPAATGSSTVQAAMIAQAAATFTSTMTNTPSEQATRSVIVAAIATAVKPTETPTIVSTATSTNTATIVLTETATIPTDTPTTTFTSTEEPTEISVQDSAATLIAEQWTETANAIASYTKTPLPTGTPTLNREQTVAAVAALTETAYAVASHTKTSMPTGTYTPTFTAAASSLPPTMTSPFIAAPTNTIPPTSKLVSTPSETPPVLNTFAPSPDVEVGSHDQLALRSGPGTSYPMVTIIKGEAGLSILGRTPDNAWLNVRYNDLVGWVAARFVTVYADLSKVAVITNTDLILQTPDAEVGSHDQLALRSGPGTSYPVITTIKGEAGLSILGRTPDNAWLNVRYNDSVGWVAAQLVNVYVDLSKVVVITNADLILQTNAMQAATADASSKPQFVHVADPSNISGAGTVIQNPMVNGNPGAILFVSPRWGVSNAYNPHAIGVIRAGSKWAIINQDNAGMPRNAAFNVVAVGAAPNVFTYTASSANTSGATTTIDNAAINGHPETIMNVTISNVSAAPDPHPFGVAYNGLVNEWAVTNLDGGAMPQNAAFNVEALPEGSNAFSLQAVNTNNNEVLIDNGGLNGHPEMLVFVTSVSGVTNNPHYIGVYYVTAQNKWAIFNEDPANPGNPDGRRAIMAVGATYYVTYVSP